MKPYLVRYHVFVNNQCLFLWYFFGSKNIDSTNNFPDKKQQKQPTYPSMQLYRKAIYWKKKDKRKWWKTKLMTTAYDFQPGHLWICENHYNYIVIMWYNDFQIGTCLECNSKETDSLLLRWLKANGVEYGCRDGWAIMHFARERGLLSAIFIRGVNIIFLSRLIMAAIIIVNWIHVEILPRLNSCPG